MAGPTTGTRSIGRTAWGLVFRKHSTAPIQNTVVGMPGVTIPTAPVASQAPPTPSSAQRSRRDRRRRGLRTGSSVRAAASAAH